MHPPSMTPAAFRFSSSLQWTKSIWMRLASLLQSTSREPAYGYLLDADGDALLQDGRVLWIMQLQQRRILHASIGVEEIYGHTKERFVADHSLWLECIAPGDRQQLQTLLTTIGVGQSHTLSLRINRPDGSPRWIEYQIKCLADYATGDMHVRFVGTDITTRHHLEIALARSNRALRAITACEDVIGHAANESTLLQGICDVVTATGYQLAWAGLIESDGAITPIGLTAKHQDYLDAMKVPLGAGGNGTIAIATALRTRRPAVANYFASDMSPTPWRLAAMRYGFHSKLVLPMADQDTMLGVFNVYASEPDAFDAQEVALLVSLAQRVAMELRAHRDRAGRQAAEAALRLRERAIECSANAIIISSARAPDFVIEYVNPAFERITGYSAAEAIGKNSNFLLGTDHDQPGLLEIRAALSERREGKAVLRNYRKDGSLFWNDLHIAPVTGDDTRTTHFVAAMSDITPMKQYETTLHRMANHDALTGLPNRSLLEDRLENAINYSARNEHSLWVVLVDLDRFKLINDTMGHQAGDHLLKIISDRLQSSVRESDTVARLGGDEFVLVLPECADGNASSAADVIQRIMDAVIQPLTIRGNEYVLGCSMGVAVYPNDGTDPATLMAHADVAMYRAKDNGGNSFQFYTPVMHDAALKRLQLEYQLRRAIELDELTLHYQPQVDLRHGTIVGMEALIRWNHPQMGLITPGSFIGMAEETGLILPIGIWVLRTACLQAKKWQDMGHDNLRIAVNLSARQFVQTDLTETIADILQQTGLPPHCLEIELTESSVMADIERHLLILHAIKALGVHLSVDDFGTGHSSLAYLKRFPIDTLKIDRSFVRDIALHQDDASIVATIIALGHNLHLQVIAEGVETENQMAVLRAQGCDQMQGYYFSKPLPAEQIEALFLDQQITV
ncbi:sensor domain-containing protein [Oxalicibacterium faecigallinarum]|nr:EAL domain-containing protein [Oxalicibacterium faecigallinarum]